MVAWQHVISLIAKAQDKASTEPAHRLLQATMWPIGLLSKIRRHPTVGSVQSLFEHSIRESVECIEGLTAESLAGENKEASEMTREMLDSLEFRQRRGTVS